MEAVALSCFEYKDGGKVVGALMDFVNAVVLGLTVMNVICCHCYCCECCYCSCGC